MEQKKKYSSSMMLSVLFVIYITDSLLFATNSVTIMGILQRVLPIAGVLLLAFNRPPKLYLSTVISAFLILCSMILANRAFDGFFYITTIVLVVFGDLYSRYCTFEEFSDCFLKIMRIIAIISLVAWLFSKIIVSLSFVPTIINTSGNPYKCLLFTNVPVGDFKRNWGPFWEPGCYQAYLNIAFLLAVFKQKKNWILDAFLFAFTALTTLSGAAILPMPFVLLAFLLDNQKKAENNKKKSGIAPIVFVSTLCGCMVMLFYSGMFDDIIGKLMNTAGTNSIDCRIGAMKACLHSTLSHPFFGASPDYVDIQLYNYIGLKIGYNYTGNTNTMFSFFAYFGVFVGTMFCKRIFGFTKNLSSGYAARILIFIALFLATSNECLASSILIFVLMYLNSEGVVKNEGCSD